MILFRNSHSDCPLSNSNFKHWTGGYSAFCRKTCTKKTGFCQGFFKVTSAKKNFCHLIALNLLIWRKKVLFSRYDEPTYFKICDATQTKLHIRSYNFNCFFIILGSIKIKFAQILMQIMTNISNLFLAVLRRH